MTMLREAYALRIPCVTRAKKHQQTYETIVCTILPESQRALSQTWVVVEFLSRPLMRQLPGYWPVVKQQTWQELHRFAIWQQWLSSS